ncbi:hypothetical protein TNCV_1615051 [Trichonephila clavipes]|nr:hypothetical protein TNCV_1615051 [Trichonephila clavipes]
MPNKSPFAVHKALIGIGGEPKTVKRLLSGDLLIETNFAIQTKSTSSSSTQAQLLPPTSSISTSNSESQPPIPTCTDAPSNNMVTPIESSSSIIPTSSSQSVIQPPSDSNTVQDAKKLAKARSRKRKKELLKKMKEAIIDIKMNPHRPKKKTGI